MRVRVPVAFPFQIRDLRVLDTAVLVHGFTVFPRQPVGGQVFSRLPSLLRGHSAIGGFGATRPRTENRCTSFGLRRLERVWSSCAHRYFI